MATCPECSATYGDDVQACPTDGAALLPDELVLAESRALAEAPLKAGTMVGEYRIERKLGAGTFGDVYAGEQPVIGKRVAVKVLNRRFASDPVMVSRFVAEARAVNKIRQRNIIDIFSFGVLPGLDRHYFVMELLDGMTLGAMLDRTGALPVALVLPIVRGMADALDAVHEAGITHRDLKPDNVFLAQERDGSYFPKLLDFGIAKLVGEDSAHKTGSGMVLGTPRYMSPEQARGKPADHRADVYALGVMIHEMLTGGPLFVGDSAVDMLLKQAVDPPPRMSSVSADVPPGLDAPVLAMLEKRPQDRPSSAGAAVAALAARARELGIDSAGGVTLADLAMEDSPTRRGVPRFAGTTVTVRRDRRGGRAPSPPVFVDEALSKTERAPASDPDRTALAGRAAPRAAIDSTLRSKTPAVAVSDATSAPGSDVTSDVTRAPVSEPDEERVPSHKEAPTEGVSTLETASAIERRTRARRFQVAAGAGAMVAVALSAWALGRTPERARSRALSIDVPEGTSSAAPAQVAASSASSDEPTVKPDVISPDVVVRITTHPTDVEVWTGDRNRGTSTGPVSLPRSSARVELRLRKPGFNDELVTLVPDHDQGLEATLTPLSAHGAAAGPASRPAAPRSPAAPTAKAAAGDGKLERVLGGRD